MFNQAVEVFGGKNPIIYKGFKLSNINEEYAILDVRKSDYYDRPTARDIETLVAYGFIKGADIISIDNCAMHIDMFNRNIASLRQLVDSDNFSNKKVKGFLMQIEILEDGIDTYSRRLERTRSKLNY